MLSPIAGLLLATLLPMQDSGAGSENVRRTADAARAIAREFGLASWSERLIDRGLAATTDAEDRSTLLLARCDVLLVLDEAGVDRLHAIALRHCLVIFNDKAKARELFLVLGVKIGDSQ